MILRDLHTHTTYCDGANTPAEMAQAALEKGLKCLGFSGHCYTFFDESYCMSKEATARYREEIAALKEAYAGRLEILCGIEQDYWSEASIEGYDFVIGSVHYVKQNGKYLPVDESLGHTKDAIEKEFGGDPLLMAECYFATVADVVNKTNCTIIGHFDLLTKFQEREKLFDTSHPRYVQAWQAATDALIQTGVPFEINTGAMSRGYRRDPYPAMDIIAYIRAKGGKLILSSDSHSRETLLYGFETYEHLTEAE